MECFHFQWALSQVNISRSKLVLKLNYSYLLEHSREWLWSVCTFTKGILAGWPPVSSHLGWKKGYNNHLVWQWYWTDDIFLDNIKWIKVNILQLKCFWRLNAIGLLESLLCGLEEFGCICNWFSLTPKILEREGLVLCEISFPNKYIVWIT